MLTPIKPPSIDLQVKAVDSVYKHHLYNQQLTLTVNGAKYSATTDITG